MQGTDSVYEQLSSVNSTLEGQAKQFELSKKNKIFI